VSTPAAAEIPARKCSGAFTCRKDESEVSDTTALYFALQTAEFFFKVTNVRLVRIVFIAQPIDLALRLFVYHSIIISNE